MNLHDSEHIAGVLEGAGFRPASSPETGGVLVLNTCCVRQSAEAKVWGTLGSLRKDEKGEPTVAVCGCMAQRHGSEILNRFPVVDLVFGLDSIGRLPGLLRRSRRFRFCDIGDVNAAGVDHLPASRQSRLRAWVPVSQGCDRNCSYCVVPLVRGRERSRPYREILEEVERLAGEGVAEVTLLGQNVNSYGRDLEDGVSFPELLDAVAAVEGITRVRYETSHPGDLSDDLLRVMASRDAVCEHLHLPVQSGSNRTLDMMERGYDRDYYRDRVARARQLVPDLTVTTDIMVGFPGETEQDFLDTLDMVETVRFDAAYTFMYSRREGTAAAEMEQEIPNAVKTERLRRLNSLQSGVTARALERFRGRTVEVLLEGPARSGDFLKGRTRGNQVILVPSRQASPDSLVTAEVIEVGRHALRGRVV